MNSVILDFASGSSLYLEPEKNSQSVSKLVIKTEFGLATFEPSLDGSTITYQKDSGVIQVGLPDDRTRLSLPFLLPSDKTFLISPSGLVEVHEDNNCKWNWVL